MRRRILFLLLVLASFTLKAQMDYLHFALLVEDSTGFHWSQEPLAGSQLTQMANFQWVSSEKLAQESEGCGDFDCYLSAAYLAGAELIGRWSSGEKTFQVYETETGKPMGEVPLDNPLSILSQYIDITLVEADTLITELDTTTIEVVIDTTEVQAATPTTTPPPAAVEAPPAETPSSLVELSGEPTEDISRRTRVFDYFHRNPRLYSEFPDLLSVPSETKVMVALPLMSQLRVTVHNNLISPGWVENYFQGQFLDELQQRDLVNTFRGKQLDLSLLVEFPTVMAFRYGPVQYSLAAHFYTSFSLPSDLLAVPFWGIRFDTPLDSLKLDVEGFSYTRQTLAVGYPLTLPLGLKLRLGGALHLLKGFGYLKLHSEDITIISTPDSVTMGGSVEALFNPSREIGTLADPKFDRMDPNNFAGATNIGFSLSAGADLYPLLGQPLQVQASIMDIGSHLTWPKVSRQLYTAHTTITDVADLASADSIKLDSLLAPQEILVDSLTEASVNLPTRLLLSTTYQPFPWLLLQAQLRLALQSGTNYNGTSQNYLLTAAFFPLSWLELSGSLGQLAGMPRLGARLAFHFKHYELTIAGTALGAIGADSKGLQLSLRQTFFF